MLVAGTREDAISIRTGLPELVPRSGVTWPVRPWWTTLNRTTGTGHRLPHNPDVTTPGHAPDKSTTPQTGRRSDLHG